ncbi:MAG: ring-opening amidohydrolase [Acidimicrobiales bacterium]
MNVASLHRIITADPSDTSGLLEAVEHGLDPSRVVAVVGKTEGNGCVNDFTRGMAAAAWQAALPVPVIAVMSGGTEGVLSPHVTVIAEEDEDERHPAGALVVAAARTSTIRPEMLGQRTHAEAVASTVRQLCAITGVANDDVHFVVVKCPLRTVGSETYASMASSRAASALGVARALDEISDDELVRGLAGDTDVHSAVASTSAGVEVDCCEVVLLGHHPDAHGTLRAGHVVMRDALDIGPVQNMLADIEAVGGQLLHLFAKAEADPTSGIRGRRHTMLTDSDIHSTRHARAALGGILAALSGETAIYVSGGAEHQGPAGGGPVTAIWQLPTDTQK